MHPDWPSAGVNLAIAVLAGIPVSWALAVWARRGTGIWLLTVAAFLAMAHLPAMVGLLLLVVKASPDLARINMEFGNAARSLGASERRIFGRVLLPAGRRAILEGIAFAALWSVSWAVLENLR